MTMQNQKKVSSLNQIITILTVILGLTGMYCLFFMISMKFEDDPDIAAGFGVGAVIVLEVIGLIISAIILGVAMEHELKNRKMTIIPILIFVLSIVIIFFN